MKARDVMTRKVLTATTETPVAKLAQTMTSRRVSALPVIDRRRQVIGIVSEGDLLRRIEGGTVRRPSWWMRLLAEPDSQARSYIKSRGGLARDVMTREIVSVTEDTDVAEIADLMENWGIKRVPVVRAGKLVGIVSRSDLLRAVGRSKAGTARGRVADAEIRDRLRRKLDAAPWLGAALVNFVVRGGKIELSGVVGSEPQRQALRVMAENIVGAGAVKDDLSIMPRSLYA
jgi:CBS domain-containing protein